MHHKGLAFAGPFYDMTQYDRNTIPQATFGQA